MAGPGGPLVGNPGPAADNHRAMLISHRARFIYTKTIKTGGTSVEAYFEPWCMAEGEWTPSHGREECVSPAGIVGQRAAQIDPASRWWNHMPARQVRAQVEPAVWDGYCKFCVVRNPFERAVSAYYFFRPAGAEPPDREAAQADFLAWLRQEGLPDDREAYLIDGRFCLDLVLRHERLAEDLEALCRRLEVPWEPARLPRYKAGIRPPHASVGWLFTAAARRLVEDRLGQELERFGYGFPADG